MRSRILILLGLVVILAAVGVFVLMQEDAAQDDDPNGEGTGSAAGGVVATPVEIVPQIDTVEIVIAIQDLSRGMVIPENGVSIQQWPREALPESGNYFLAEDIDLVVGKIARTDIFRGSPILSRYVVDNLFDIARAGSDAAAVLNGLPADRNWVAVSIPLDPSGIGQVAYGIQDGDFVDVILSFLFVDVDPTFQTRLPNNVSLITRLETGELSIGAPRQGRTEASALTPEGVLLGPSEPSQRPRLVTQYTVQNAFVVHVGHFDETGVLFGQTPTPTQMPTQAAPGEQTQQQEQRPTALPTATPFTPLIVTLGVTPQDALVLTWAVDSQIPITLALRAAGDDRVVTTEPVTLDYMIRNYNAEPPNALEFALEPPITSVRRFDIASLFDFLSSGVATE